MIVTEGPRPIASSESFDQPQSRPEALAGPWQTLYAGRSETGRETSPSQAASGLPGTRSGIVSTVSSSLIGREREMAAVTSLLQQPGVRLITLLGPGGVGKTRLAQAVAQAAADDFPDGIWIVPLAAVRDPALVAGSIAQALQTREGSHRPPLDEVAACLQAKKGLLVLDNFEHVLSCAAIVAELLARCPRVTCLVTSRALLRISDEQAFPVPPLSLPTRALSLTLEEAVSSAAMHLFVTRAQAVRPDFTLSPENVAAVEAIARRLDGLPLALELAAARVRHLSPEELATRLLGGAPGTALGMLTGGPRDAPNRQQTLRYAVGWSHDLLSPEERVLFRRLGAFVGGFTLEAAEAVVNLPGQPSIDVIDHIAALVDQSLIRQDVVGGASRFSMLETVREFAIEQLAASDEAAAVHQAHTAYFLALAERAALRLHSEHQERWLERLQIEHANFCEVLRRAEYQQDAARELRLAAALWRFWHRRGFWAEGLGWLNRLLEQTRNADGMDLETRARALTAAAWLAHYQNDFVQAGAALSEVLTADRGRVSAEIVVEALICQSLIAQLQGENRRAAELCEEALAVSRTLGDHARIAESLCGLSRATRELGNYTRAADLGLEALDLNRSGRHRGGVANALLTLGDVARDLGQTAETQWQCDEALTIFRALGEPLGEGFALHNLAVAAYGEGDFDQARLLGEQSLAIFRRLDVQNAMAEVLCSLGPILAVTGDPAAGLAALHEAIELARAVGPRWVIAASLEGVASVAAHQGQPHAAVELASGAAALRQDIGVPVRANWQPDLDDTIDQARGAFNAGAYAAAWERGEQSDIGGLLATAAHVKIVTTAPVARTKSAPKSTHRAGLSARELDVLRLLVDSKTDREIADTLFISPRTASKHVGSILLKLDVTSRNEAAIEAIRNDYL